MENRHKHHLRIALLILTIPALALVGYGIMHALVYIVPMAGYSMWSYWVASATITLLALAVPYWILKTGFMAWHMSDRREKRLHLEDLPKNQRRARRASVRERRARARAMRQPARAQS